MKSAMICIDFYVGSGAGAVYLGSLSLRGNGALRLADIDRVVMSEKTEHGFMAAAYSVMNSSAKSWAGRWPWAWGSSRHSDVTYYWSTRSERAMMVRFGGRVKWPTMRVCKALVDPAKSH